jgi:proteasome-associated ATPase
LEKLLRDISDVVPPEQRFLLQEAIRNLKEDLLEDALKAKANAEKAEFERTILLKKIETLKKEMADLDRLQQQTLSSYQGYRTKAESAIASLKNELEKLQAYVKELEKLIEPPRPYGTFLRKNEDGTIDILIRGERMSVVAAEAIDATSLRLGQRLLLTPQGNVLAALDEFEELGIEATVEETYEDGRVVVSSRAGEMAIVFRADNLRERALATGDRVLYEPRLGCIFEVLPKKESSDLYLEEIPDVRFTDIGGQEKALEQLRDYLELPLLYPEKFTERYHLDPPKGLLLYGPPGCGKTKCLKALANEIRQRGRKVYQLYVAGPQLLTMWVGETERKIREPFEIAKAKAKTEPDAIIIVHFDEIDAMFPSRGSRQGDAGVSATSVTQFSTMLDGLVEYRNIRIVATTNRPDQIDPALTRPGRLFPAIEFPRPDEEGVRAIARIYLSTSYPIHPQYTDPQHPQYDSRKYAGFPEDREKIVDYFVHEFVKRIFDERMREKQRVVTIEYLDGAQERRTFYMKDLISGALIEETVKRAKMLAIKDEIRLGVKDEWGLKLGYLYKALEEAFKAGEALPNLTAPQEWARILNLREDRPFRVVVSDRSDNGDRGDESLDYSVA